MTFLLLRLGGILCCGAATWWSWRLVQADNLFRADTSDSVRRATELVPDQPAYAIRLAQLDPEHAEVLLEKALVASRYAASAAVDLGLLRESRGDFQGAEKLLLRAFEMDRTYLPRWTLANFYLRRQDLPRFWKWARKCAEMPAAELGALFELCLRATGDVKAIERNVLTGDPAVVRDYLGFLGRHELTAAAESAPMLVERGTPEQDRVLLVAITDQLISRGDGSSAAKVWNAMAAKRWIARDSSLIQNPDFRRTPLEAGFDWRLPQYEGINGTTGSAGLRVEFSGGQPESCVIAQQAVVLDSGEYEFSYRYRTAGIVQETGLHWKLANAKTGAVLAVSPELAAEGVREDSMRFRNHEPESLMQIRLEYQRAIGTPRISGALTLIHTRLRSYSHDEMSKMQ